MDRPAGAPPSPPADPGPSRRPRRSAERRAHPYAGPSRTHADDEAGPSELWTALLAADVAAATRPPQRAPRHEYTVPPSDEETSEEEPPSDEDDMGDTDTGEEDSDGAVAGGAEEEEEGGGDGGAEERGEGMEEETMESAGEGRTEGDGSGDGGEDEDTGEAMQGSWVGGDRGEGDSDEEDGEEDSSAFLPSGRQPLDVFTEHLRGMEDATQPFLQRAHHEAQGRHLYQGDLRRADTERATRSCVRLRGRRRRHLIVVEPPGPPLAVDRNPHAMFEDMPRNGAAGLGDTWDRDIRRAVAEENLALRRWYFLYYRHQEAPGARHVAMPSTLTNVDPDLFRHRLAISQVLCDVCPQHWLNEMRMWSEASTVHDLPVASWSPSAPAYSRGGMYAGGSGEPGAVFVRALKQAIALQHAMCVAGLVDGVARGGGDGRGLHFTSAFAFLVDAVMRVAQNCHYAAVDIVASAAAGCEDTLDSRAFGTVTLLRTLPAEAAGPLAVTQYVLPGRGPIAAVCRDHMGSLLYWSIIRAALRHVGSTVAVRTSGVVMQAAEVSLLVIANSRNPRCTPHERHVMAQYFALGGLLLEATLQWLYTASAYLLCPEQDYACFNAVRSSRPYTRVPVGCVSLVNAEHAVLRTRAMRDAHRHAGLSAALLEAYMGTRNMLTLQMHLFGGVTPPISLRERTASANAFLTISLLAQRLMGYLNFLFCVLAGSAVYGGQSCAVPTTAVARYSTLADAFQPLVRNLPLAEFWERREEAMRDLHLTPRPGPPTTGKRVIISLFTIIALTGAAPPQPLSDEDCLGEVTDLARLLSGYPHLLYGAGEAARAGTVRRGLRPPGRLGCDRTRHGSNDDGEAEDA